jgi:hypothetical protein
MQPGGAILLLAPLPGAPAAGQREVFARLRTYGWLRAQSDWFSSTRHGAGRYDIPPFATHVAQRLQL